MNINNKKMNNCLGFNDKMNNINISNNMNLKMMNDMNMNLNINYMNMNNVSNNIINIFIINNQENNNINKNQKIPNITIFYHSIL